MRLANHAGTWPPWSERSAVPECFTTLSPRVLLCFRPIFAYNQLHGLGTTRLEPAPSPFRMPKRSVGQLSIPASREDRERPVALSNMVTVLHPSWHSLLHSPIPSSQRSRYCKETLTQLSRSNILPVRGDFCPLLIPFRLWSRPCSILKQAAWTRVESRVNSMFR